MLAFDFTCLTALFLSIMVPGLCDFIILPVTSLKIDCKNPVLQTFVQRRDLYWGSLHFLHQHFASGWFKQGTEELWGNAKYLELPSIRWKLNWLKAFLKFNGSIILVQSYCEEWVCPSLPLDWLLVPLLVLHSLGVWCCCVWTVWIFLGVVLGCFEGFDFLYDLITGKLWQTFKITLSLLSF